MVGRCLSIVTVGDGFDGLGVVAVAVYIYLGLGDDGPPRVASTFRTISKYSSSVINGCLSSG